MIIFYFYIFLIDFKKSKYFNYKKNMVLNYLKKNVITILKVFNKNNI